MAAYATEVETTLSVTIPINKIVGIKATLTKIRSILILMLSVWGLILKVL